MCPGFFGCLKVLEVEIVPRWCLANMESLDPKPAPFGLWSLAPTGSRFWFADAGTKRPTTKNALPYIQRTGLQNTCTEVKPMQIQHVSLMALFVFATALAGPGITEFRPVSKPATRAPFSPAEIVAQAKLVQRCDPKPSKPIALVPSGAVSKRIKRLFDDDQNARMAEKIDWNMLQREDQIRRQEVIQYILRDQLSIDTDFIGAGFIYQHGPCADSYLLAHQLAGYAIALSEGIVSTGQLQQSSRWLYAAAYDRYLLTNGLPQRFGTQYRFAGPNCSNVPAPFDPKTTSEERTLYGVAFDAETAMAAAAKCP
jgi:hypothetical protein